MTSAMPFLLGVFLAFSSGQAQPQDLVVGSWLNEDQASGGITQVVVRRDNDRLFVHAWGSCTPSDCDWGETASEPWNGSAVANWDHGFATERMQLIPLRDGRLLVATRAEYRDGSGRTDKGRAEFFARENSRTEGPETARAREVLKQVAETYRRLPASRFESTETVQRTTERSETRSQVHWTILLSPPNKWRRERSGGKEVQIEIADGRTRWTVYPQANEYRRVDQGSSLQPFLYALLDEGRNPPRVVRQERFDGTDCTVVRLDLGRGTTEDLWVDNASHLIRKDLETSPGLTREIVFLTAHLGESIEPRAVTYAPETTHAVNRTEASRRAPGTMVGTPAPDISLRDVAGREVRLRDLRGKVVLLDFWATWCGYCREELPTIELYHRGLRSKGLAVFGVDDEPAEVAGGYLQKYGYTLPSLVDSRGEATRAFRVEAWPTTIVIDRDGKVIFYASGAEPQKLRDAIRAAGAW